MRNLFRATVLVGLLALATVFIKPVLAVGPTTKIVLDPSTVSIPADASQTFKVMAIASDGSSTDVTSQSTLSVNDPLGKVVGATYTPGKAGTWAVQASFQSFTNSAAVTVTPGAPAEIVINPNSGPEQAYLGTNVKFGALVYDAKSNIVAGQKIVWSVVGENGSIDAQGVFVPKQVGTSKVQAADGTITGQVSVVVNPVVVTNTNTATVVNTNKATNTTKNTNTVAATNAANSNTTTNAAVTTTTGDEKTTSCTTLKPWVWILILIVFLGAVAVLFALVPITAIWPAVVALLGGAILAYVQRKYDCNGYAWWAWVIMLGTIALAAIQLMMRPKNTSNV